MTASEFKPQRVLFQIHGMVAQPHRHGAIAFRVNGDLTHDRWQRREPGAARWLRADLPRRTGNLLNERGGIRIANVSHLEFARRSGTESNKRGSGLLRR